MLDRSGGGVVSRRSHFVPLFLFVVAGLAWYVPGASVRAQAPAPAPAPAPSDDGQWVMPGKDYALKRYSGLDQINTENVKDLRVAWTFSLGVNRGQEAPPIVVGKTMYVVTPYPNILYALDLKNPGSVKWKYEPKPAAAAQGVACCDYVNRGCFYYEGKLYYNTLDCHVACVNAADGKEVWKTRVGDINLGETMTMAPLVVKGKVLVGNSGGEFGVRGWLKALDANNGKVAWTAYSTGPDSDCLIGPNFKPYYSTDQGKDLGVKTWPPDRWKIGGGTVWGWVSYDPDLDLAYYGTGNPAVAGPNPWGGETLVWAAASPVPSYNFLYTPTVRGRSPMWENAPDAPVVTGSTPRAARCS